jgi:hypothetical protein
MEDNYTVGTITTSNWKITDRGTIILLTYIYTTDYCPVLAQVVGLN